MATDGNNAPSEKRLDQMWGFLSDKFDRLPSWAQSVAYFLILVFFLVGIAHTFGAKYVVTGAIFDGTTALGVPNCEVRFGGEFFGTNSAGEYRVLLSQWDYFALMAKRHEDLRLNRDKKKIGDYPVSLLDVFGNEFSDITLNPAASHTPGLAASPVSAESELLPRRWSFDIISSAFAQQPAGVDLLYIDRISPSPLLRIRDAALELDLDHRQLPLLSLGSSVNHLTLRFGSPTAFATSAYYFEVPQSRRGAKASIALSSGSVFNSYDETFNFAVPTAAKQWVIKGTNGTLLTVHFAPASAVGIRVLQQRVH